MPAPFVELDNETLDDDLAFAKGIIENGFADLEQIFADLQTSNLRLKAIPGMPIPTLVIPFELAIGHCLRALELVGGAARLIESNNQVAAFPVLRSLFETWILLSYAELRLVALTIDESKWSRHDEIALRLLLGRTQDGGQKIIKIGNMIDEVHRARGEKGDNSPDVLEWYSYLSDGTHPTSWSSAYHVVARADSRGLDWTRVPDSEGRGELILDLAMLVELVASQLQALMARAQEIKKAFKAGPYLDPDNQAKAVASMRRIVGSARPPNMSDEAYRLAQQRAALVIEMLDPGPSVDADNSGP